MSAASRALTVLRGEGVVPPVHGAVGEVVIVVELLGQGFRTLEIPVARSRWQTPRSES